MAGRTMPRAFLGTTIGHPVGSLALRHPRSRLQFVAIMLAGSLFPGFAPAFRLFRCGTLGYEGAGALRAHEAAIGQ